MKIKDFFSLIIDFSDEDSQEFVKFLNSPFHGNNKMLIDIFEEIMRNKNLIISSQYERLIKNISVKLRRTHSTLMNRLSYLSKSAKDFLKIKSILTDGILTEFSLNEYLLKHKSYSILKTNLKNMETIIYDSEKITDKFLWNSFNYNVQVCDFFTFNNSFISNNNSKQILSNLHNASLDIFLYYLVQQINLYVYNFILDVESGNYGKFYFPIDITKTLNNFEKGGLLNNSYRKKNIYELYKSMYFAFYYREDSKNFLKYKQCFERLLITLSDELKRFHYNLLINFCVMKERLNEEKEFYRKQQAELLLEYIENGHYETVDTKHLHAAVYRNFILIAFSIENLKLLRYFIDNCSSKLNPKEYKNMLNFGLIYYYYGIKNYEKVFECIQNIEFNNFIYRFDIKNIELRIYYETHDYDKLFDSMHNYRKSIMDEKILNKQNKESLLKFIKYLGSLTKITINPNINLQKESEYLYHQISEEQSFALQKWILERLNSLVKPHLKKKKIYKK